MLTHENGLWLMLCDEAEKFPAFQEPFSLPRIPWETIYLRNPHVPLDFKDIRHAMDFVSNHSYCKSSHVTIFC